MLAHAPDDEQLEDVRVLLERHVRYTGSARAAVLLERWEEERSLLARVASTSEVDAAGNRADVVLGAAP